MTRDDRSASGLKEIKPDFVLSNDRNGACVAQFCRHEAEGAESRFPPPISIWNTSATLLSAVRAEDRGKFSGC